MSRLRRPRGGARSAAPARDLPFVDAAAVVAALFLGYAVRAANSPHYPFEWGGIAPFVRLALPVGLCVLLLSAAALGLYGERAAEAGLRQHAAAVAYAVAAAAAIGIYWGGQSAPTVPVLLTVAILLAAFLHAGRMLYWRLASPDGAVEAGASSR